MHKDMSLTAGQSAAERSAGPRTAHADPRRRRGEQGISLGLNSGGSAWVLALYKMLYMIHLSCYINIIYSSAV